MKIAESRNKKVVIGLGNIQAILTTICTIHIHSTRSNYSYNILSQSMVRKKRKSTAGHEDDILSVRKRSHLADQLQIPAFPLTHLRGYKEIGQSILSECNTVHAQLQALQSKRRQIRDEHQQNQTTLTDTQCTFFIEFLLDIISTPNSSRFHKICGLLLDDITNAKGEAAIQATRTALGVLSKQWCDLNYSKYNSLVTAESMQVLLGTVLVSEHILSEPTAINLHLVPSFIEAITLTLVNAGCTLNSQKVSNWSQFSQNEEIISKLLHVLLLLLHKIKDTMDQLSPNWSQRLGVSIRQLCQCLEQLVRCSLCVKDTLTAASMIMVLLSQKVAEHRRRKESKTVNKVDMLGLVVSLFQGTTNWSFNEAATATETASSSSTTTTTTTTTFLLLFILIPSLVHADITQCLHIHFLDTTNQLL